jgi:hypothetical protein
VVTTAIETRAKLEISFDRAEDCTAIVLGQMQVEDDEAGLRKGLGALLANVPYRRFSIRKHV